MKRNILVDGNNLFHRAHAIFCKDKTEHELMRSPSGYRTGLIYGTLSMLSDWISDISRPDQMELFLDGAPKRRLVIDPEYKAHRRQEELVEPCAVKLVDGYEAKDEIDAIVHLFRLMGANVYYHPEEEADDLIASYTRARDSDINIIISSDKDFYQLLTSDNIIIYRPGISGNRFFDAERAEEHMHKLYKVRVPPANIRMFKALTGDSSDGIVGVPRLRKRVAAPLCSLSTVDQLYETDLPGFSKAEKTKALALREKIEINYSLVGLDYLIEIEKFKEEAAPDFSLASRILQEDFGINTIHPYVFQFKNEGKMRTSGPVLPDFLDDI